MLAATISLLVIAIAWIVVRPILGIALLVLAVGGFIFTKKLAASSKGTAPSSPPMHTPPGIPG